ncbi:MAG: hypothetical protein IT557_03950 [Alphaproteobacteria bacterium]|nr:hypothetical protein [Alphaproteobacteria bacterium]
MRNCSNPQSYRTILHASVFALGMACVGLPALAEGGGDSPGGSAATALPGDGPPAATRRPALRGGFYNDLADWQTESSLSRGFSFNFVADNGLTFGTRIEIPDTPPNGSSGSRDGLDLRWSGGVSDNGLSYGARVDLSPPAEAATVPKGPPMMLRVNEATGEVSLLVREDFVTDGVPDFEAAARAYRDYYGSDPPFRVPPNPPRPGRAGSAGRNGQAQAPEESVQFQYGSGPLLRGASTDPPTQGTSPPPSPRPATGTPDDGNRRTFFTPRFQGLELGVRYTPSGLETQIRGALQSEDSALLESAIREFGTPEARAELERQKTPTNQAAPQTGRAGGRQ